MAGEVGEVGEFEEGLAGDAGLVDGLVLEDPGVVVGDEDGVEAGGEGGIDVGAGAVADHPGRRRFEGVVAGQGEVGVGVFFGEDLDVGEEVGEAGAGEFFALLGFAAFGDENEAVAEGEVGEGGGDGGEELDLLVGDGLGEADDAVVALGGDGRGGELLEAGDERVAEGGDAVAVLGDRGALDGVEAFADLFGGVDAVVEVGDEGGEGALEVDVVLPKGVVGVEEKGLGEAARGSCGDHARIIGGWGGGPVRMR